LHAVCSSRWHVLDPSRADGLAEVARLLLDAGADYGTMVLAAGRRGQARRWPALFCAATGASNEPIIRLLLERGAGLEARDTAWNSTPLDWAKVGSGMPGTGSPDADWVTTVRPLIEAGASTSEVTLSPDDRKPPSPQVAQLLRSYGVGGAKPEDARA
jgi:hypothetical protein